MSEEPREDVLWWHAVEEVLQQSGVPRPCGADEHPPPVPQFHHPLLLGRVRPPGAQVLALRHQPALDGVAQQLPRTDGWASSMSATARSRRERPNK